MGHNVKVSGSFDQVVVVGYHCDVFILVCACVRARARYVFPDEDLHFESFWSKATYLCAMHTLTLTYIVYFERMDFGLDRIMFEFNT